MSDKTPYTTLRETSINEDSFINYIINNEKVWAVKYVMGILDIKIHHC